MIFDYTLIFSYWQLLQQILDGKSGSVGEFGFGDELADGGFDARQVSQRRQNFFDASNVARLRHLLVQLRNKGFGYCCARFSIAQHLEEG